MHGGAPRFAAGGTVPAEGFFNSRARLHPPTRTKPPARHRRVRERALVPENPNNDGVGGLAVKYQRKKSRTGTLERPGRVMMGIPRSRQVAGIGSKPAGPDSRLPGPPGDSSPRRASGAPSRSTFPSTQ